MSKEASGSFKKAESALKKYNRFGKESKLKDAIDLFQKSANSYESANDWDHAGEAYAMASDCLQNDHQLIEAAIAAEKAGQMYLKNKQNGQKAYEQFALAARFYREDSKPTNAAKLLYDAGKLFEQQKDTENAIHCYKDAAQIYDDEKKPTQAANQITIIADMYSEQKNWIEASNYYNDVAKRRYTQPITKTSAFEYCMKAVLCRMAGDDIVGAEKYLNGYLVDFSAWARSREYTFLHSLDRAINDHDPDTFQTIVDNYNEITMLDNWMMNCIQAIKDLLVNGEEEEIC